MGALVGRPSSAAPACPRFLLAGVTMASHPCTRPCSPPVIPLHTNMFAVHLLHMFTMQRPLMPHLRQVVWCTGADPPSPRPCVPGSPSALSSLLPLPPIPLMRRPGVPVRDDLADLLLLVRPDHHQALLREAHVPYRLVSVTPFRQELVLRDLHALPFQLLVPHLLAVLARHAQQQVGAALAHLVRAVVHRLFVSSARRRVACSCVQVCRPVPPWCVHACDTHILAAVLLPSPLLPCPATPVHCSCRV